jgi:hypothetical protein
MKMGWVEKPATWPEHASNVELGLACAGFLHDMAVISKHEFAELLDRVEAGHTRDFNADMRRTRET